MNERYTVDGGDELEAKLADNCRVTLEGVRRLIPAGELEALLLAGGYGRGEGGVLRTPAGDKPYNDMEFYVFVRGNALLAERRYRHALHELGEALTPEAELEIEFKVITFDKLRRSPVNMFYYDLVEGHRWALGDEALLRGCEHHRVAAEIPLHEATRLLFNRASGLLFAKARLAGEAFTPADGDFVGRNCAKVQLAIGDALLTAEGRYHWSCRERGKRLVEARPGLPEELVRKIGEHHARGVRFKLYPEQSKAGFAELAALHTELTGLAREVWLYIERRRLSQRFESAQAYALSGVDKCPETPGWRNRLVNAKSFGPMAGLSGGAGRYPRERLFNALALLLWTDRGAADERQRRVLRENLRTSADTFDGFVAAYEKLWHQFN